MLQWVAGDYVVSPLVSSGECLVEFLYIKPTDATDNRRWQTGFVRGSRELMEKTNIHNHTTHPSSKIPCKIQNDIHDAITENPHLKTSDLVEGNRLSCCKLHVCLLYTYSICTNNSQQAQYTGVCGIDFLITGRGMGYIASAVSLATANKGKIKHIWNSALRQSSVPSIACILDFEKQATKHDRQMRSTAGNHEGTFTYSFHHYTGKYSNNCTYTNQSLLPTAEHMDEH